MIKASFIVKLLSGCIFTLAAGLSGIFFNNDFSLYSSSMLFFTIAALFLGALMLNDLSNYLDSKEEE